MISRSDINREKFKTNGKCIFNHDSNKVTKGECTKLTQL